jgi:hypothetical protein
MLMPPMFAKFHDKYLNNFIEKGSVRMLKYKEKVYYARNARRFIVPIVARIKVEYMNY